MKKITETTANWILYGAIALLLWAVSVYFWYQLLNGRQEDPNITHIVVISACDNIDFKCPHCGQQFNLGVQQVNPSQYTITTEPNGH